MAHASLILISSYEVPPNQRGKIVFVISKAPLNFREGSHRLQRGKLTF